MSNFWNIVKDVWQQGLYGIDISRIIIAVLIFIFFLLVRKLFSSLIILKLKDRVSKTKNRFDDELLKILEQPIAFIPVVIGFFISMEYLSLPEPFSLIVDRLVRSLIVLVIFWVLIKLVEPMSFLLRSLEKIFTKAMIVWLIKAIKTAFIFIAAATILEIWGIKVGPILAGLGLIGVAVALGAQDLFKNLISGILIIAEKRFNIGDWIKVEGVIEGTVEAIGFRSTLVRRFDKAPVYIPNSQLSDNSLINFSAMSHRRIYWVIGVEYRTTIDMLKKIREGIEAYILESDDFAHPPEVVTFVRIDKFNDSSIDIMVYCFTKTTIWGEWLKIKEALAYKIKETIEGAGAGFAFPSQSIYVESFPEDQAEVFVPENMKM
ncbi:MAG: mechanosensitive ion channel family protein [Deltaproteobacteria bacterium]|nr:mechanosensitive ion channel family protein [Deltaproteobacteria bacterium]